MLILWSGGCDSTLALLKHAFLPGCRALSIEHCSVPCAVQSRRARQKILAKLRKRGSTLEHSTLVISKTGDFSPNPAGGLNQPQIWLPAAHSMLLDNEDLVTGWIRGDDVWHYRDRVFLMFQVMQEIANKTGKLDCPLEWTRKTQVIQQLQDADLYSDCWYCEQATTSKPCGHCVPCKTHRQALEELERERKHQPTKPVAGKPKKSKRK